MAKQEQKENDEKMKNKIDFPRLDVDQATHIIKKVLSSYADIIPYEELAKISTGKAVTKGGIFGQVTKSLKMYALMERYGKTEIKVTDYGKSIASAIDDNQRKKLLFKAFVGVPIFNEIYGRYKTLPKKKALTDFIKNKGGIEKREAGRLVSTYIRNFTYLDLQNKEGNIAQEISPEQIPKDRESKSFDKKQIGLFIEAGALFGTGIKNKKEKLTQLLKLSEEYKLKKFNGFLNALITLYGNKSESELEEELKKASEQILKLLNEDLEIQK